MAIADEPSPFQGIYAPDVDIDRHAGNATPSKPVPKPGLGDDIVLHNAIIQSLPGPKPREIDARKYAVSLWGLTAKISTTLQDGTSKLYFLKTVSTKTTLSASQMIRGKFESLSAIKAVRPSLVPDPVSYGSYFDYQENQTISFLLTSFVSCLADLHMRSLSPTGKFGFHITTYHATLPQLTDTWESSWSALLCQLSQMISQAKRSPSSWPQNFFELGSLIVEKVVPRLLDPLQSEGQSIKPCLVHGDLWDENTALNTSTDEPFIFDACSFYAHNEYEIGNWRARRHRLSGNEYVEAYKALYPPSDPASEWDDRNLLYSLRFDIGAVVLIPRSDALKEIVDENMR
ncbi:Fructosamine kinase domain containing protein [Rhypophila sp. PSN 637]